MRGQQQGPNFKVVGGVRSDLELVESSFGLVAELADAADLKSAAQIER